MVKGVSYALLAATCNSSIGIISNILLSKGMSSDEIAFSRCLIAFIIIAIVCVSNREVRQNLGTGIKNGAVYACLAFLGICVMYTCETTAVNYISVSLVSFLLYASGILTVVLGFLFLKERVNGIKILSIIMVLAGMGIMFFSNMKFENNMIGILFAVLAGSGYSLYIFLNKKWNIAAGIKTLFYFFLFGSVFLGFQFLAVDGGRSNVTWGCIPYLLALAIVPTIGGFYFTNKAISLMPAGEVQLVEMSEPLIATILAFIVLGQVISFSDLIGGMVILMGLFVLEWKNLSGLHRFGNRKKI